MKRFVRNIIAGVVVLAAGGGVLAYTLMPDSVDVEKVIKGNVTSSINEIGQIEADAAVTVYAPVSGKITSVAYKVNDKVKEGDVLAKYDLTDAEQHYNLAELNVTLQEDSYNAAVQDNQTNRSKAASAASKSNQLLAQYVQTQENRDDISISQNAKSVGAQRTIQGIEGELAKLQTDLEVESSKLEAGNTAYAEDHGKQLELENELNATKTKIENVKEVIESYQIEMEKYPQDSSEYANYLDMIQKESETLEELKTQKSAEKDALANIKKETENAKNAKEYAENSVNNLKNSIHESRDALASVPVDGLSTEDFAKYAELSRQLELLDKEWNTAMTQKTTAEEKIVSDAQIKSYEDSVEIAKAEEESALKELDRAKEGVKSTVVGTVLERLVDDGATTEAGTPLFVVQPDSGYKATLMVSRYDIESVEVGQKAVVTMGKTAYDGTVSAISPVATTTDASGKPKVRVEIDFDDDEAKPTIGLEAQVQIFTKEEKSVISVSDRAIYAGDDGDYVFVLKDGKAEKRSVVKGVSGEGYTEIEEGLSEGETVITSAMSDENVGKRFTPNK